MYVCLHVCLCVGGCVFVWGVFVCACVFVSVFVHLCERMRICVCVYVYVCVCVCILNGELWPQINSSMLIHYYLFSSSNIDQTW